ncbi:MAG: hypothetical protein K8T89_22690 [Planctomycetes bacterium]|nr:hypothetical protein [Planctomycetota bacterium]
MMNPIETPQTRCRAGIASGDITPPVGIYHRMWGAASHERATGVHRPLVATVLWLEPISGNRASGQLLVALDHCIFDKAEVDRMTAAICKASKIVPEQVHITTSHTHGSGLMLRSRADLPGGDLIGPYLDGVAKRLAELAPVAIEQGQPATILYGTGRCNLAAHRDAWDEQTNQFVCGLNPTGFADDTVLVARIVSDEAKTVATIVNYACHPTTLAWDNTAISPDFIGALRETIEGYSGAPCMFLQGASGDLGPREGFVGDHAVADRNGRQLAFAALAALEPLPKPGTHYVYQGPVISGAIIGAWKHEELDPIAREHHARWQFQQWTTELPYRAELLTIDEARKQEAHWKEEESRARERGDTLGTRDCRAKVEQMTRWLARLRDLPTGTKFPFQITLWQLGDALWLFVPGEHYQLLQTALRAQFPGRPILVVTLTGGWLPGYLPTESSYGKGIYQEAIALVAPGCLEALVAEIAQRIAVISGQGDALSIR